MKLKNKKRIAYIIIFSVSIILWFFSILLEYLFPVLENYSPDIMVVMASFTAILIVKRKWSEKPDGSL
ncbi:MAG: hypothetical protein IJN93_07835 [Clostridia bacterium]|nr:hypothetical protein [Clostridia bacterium]